MKSKAIKNITSSGTIKIIFSSAKSILIENQYKSIDFKKGIYINRKVLEIH